MAIKNFLFLLALISFIGGCQVLQKRQSAPIVIGQNQTLEQTTQAPTKVLPVGVFFGPGALRTYAHVGVLKALHQAQIPIVAVGGHEWGAVVAAFYAFSKSANSVEWQMLKLRKDQIPTRSFLSATLAPKESASFLQYLKFVFADKLLEETKIPFSCFTTDNERSYPVKDGKAFERVAMCASLPPMYKAFESKWIAVPNVESDWVDSLKAAGAEFLIYVDSLSEGAFFSKYKYDSQETLTALWTGIRNNSNLAQKQANMVIQTGVVNDLLDFDSRREMIKKGEEVGKSALEPLKAAIGVN
ncbi:MAG: hypothetical protein IPM57_05275 [Oligoflexia bacterium]|nr:hypothetical protein [Oligoflexia bacterium]